MSASNAEAGALVSPPDAITVPEARPADESWWVHASCRGLDVVLAVILLILLLPLFAVVAVAIKLDSRGPVIFRQDRVGRGLTTFVINKFRTMRDGAAHDTHRTFVLRLIAGDTPEHNDRPFFKMATDDRVTRVGRLLRRSSLDELPQLWNVVIGNMSLVGPRPPIRYEVDHYPRHWFERFSVKPGLTGLWQVSGRSELTLEQMIDLDIEYARNRSLWLNVRILARTVPVVLLGRGAA